MKALKTIKMKRMIQAYLIQFCPSNPSPPPASLTASLTPTRTIHPAPTTTTATTMATMATTAAPDGEQLTGCGSC